MGINNSKTQIHMKFALLVAAVSAATLTFNDKCNTDADCPKFFNEQMTCATFHESLPVLGGYKGTGKDCTLHAFCGIKHHCDKTGYSMNVVCNGGKTELNEFEQEVFEHQFLKVREQFNQQNLDMIQ